MSTLGYLANDASRLPGHNAETGYDHVGRDNGAVEHADIVLDNGELVDDGVCANVYVGSDTRGLDDGTLANKDVVAHAEGHIGEDAVLFVKVCQLKYVSVVLDRKKKKKKRGKETEAYPLYMRPGGRRQHPLLRKQYRPMAMAVLLEGAAAALLLEMAVRARSPRIMASAIMTVLPPSMMFWVPTRVAFRATLLPVSVSMYSPLGARLDMVGRWYGVSA